MVAKSHADVIAADAASSSQNVVAQNQNLQQFSLDDNQQDPMWSSGALRMLDPQHCWTSPI